MLKLKSTVAAGIFLAIIGGIIACSSQLAKSGGDAKTSSSSAGQVANVDDAPAALAAGKAAQNLPLAGSVQVAGSPVAGATVTLYAAGAGAPAPLAQGGTDGSGAFAINGGQAPEGSVFYLVAK